jgi:hypothetical protein
VVANDTEMGSELSFVTSSRGPASYLLNAPWFGDRL